MKSDEKYKSSALGVFIGFCGMITVLVVMGITSLIPGCDEFNQEVTEGIKNDPRPTNHLFNYLPPSYYRETDTLTKDNDTIWE
tara:strand:+ start:9365 stop:9613 length:249 start_codon:yes stop_codon:yes gene_type:complete